MTCEFNPRLSPQQGDVERLRRELVGEIKRLVKTISACIDECCDEAEDALAEAVAALTVLIEEVAGDIPAAGDATPETVTYGAASVGTSEDYAREDHNHDLADHAGEHLPTGGDALTTATAITITDSTNSVGSANSLSRSDHGHAHGDRGGGSLHADVIAGGADGFMTGADKTKLDGLAAAPTAGQTLLVPPGFGNTGSASTKSITSGRTFAVYMGRLPRAVTAVRVIHEVTTAITATISWAEVAVATGLPVTNGNPTLTVVGLTNVAATYNSLGVKDTSITATIAAGEHWWLLYGNSTTGTVTVLQAASSPDRILAGHQCQGAVRPTTILNTPTAFTQEGNTVLPAWTAGWA